MADMSSSSSSAGVLEPAVATLEATSDAAVSAPSKLLEADAGSELLTSSSVMRSELAKESMLVVVEPSTEGKAGEYAVDDEAMVGVGTSEPRVEAFETAPSGVGATDEVGAKGVSKESACSASPKASSTSFRFNDSSVRGTIGESGRFSSGVDNPSS
jgi:hypothetical protein